MKGNTAWKAGKGVFNKFNGKDSNKDPTIRNVDHAHYRGTLIKTKTEDGKLVFTFGKIGEHHRKDAAYYEYKGIPKKDAKILANVVLCARFLDNGFYMPLTGVRIGANTIIELIPALGDFAGTALAFVLVVAPTMFVSKGLDHDRRNMWGHMIFNMSKEFGIGLIPFAGDWIDTMKKYNVRNADALEKMLLKRVDKASKPTRNVENVPQTTGSQRTTTNKHHVAATKRHQDSERQAHAPPRYITANDLRQSPGPVATTEAPVIQSQSKQSGGNFFRRRGVERGHDTAGVPMEEATPVRPPRPQHSTQEHGGQF